MVSRDARAQLTPGPDFGDPGVDTEPVFERLNRHNPQNKGARRSLVADYGNPRAWYGAKATTAVACTTDDQVIDAVIDNVATHDYTFARMTELSNIQHCELI